jgi:hypothetical protein
MFVQAENDYDLSPSYALAKALQAMGKPHKLAIYPPYGQSVQDERMCSPFSMRT